MAESPRPWPAPWRRWPCSASWRAAGAAWQGSPETARWILDGLDRPSASCRSPCNIAADLRRGRAGVDVIALLAMAGALMVGEELAGAVVALMLAGGQELESFAGRRARRELAALAARAPRIAHRIVENGVVDQALPRSGRATACW